MGSEGPGSLVIWAWHISGTGKPHDEKYCPGTQAIASDRLSTPSGDARSAVI
jgi:hypothetical protein